MKSLNTIFCFLRNLIVIVSLFFIAECQALKYQLSICAIFRNEGRFLKEWIEFHKIQGVEHFYLYNHFSSDNYLEVLEPYIKNGQVDLIDWHYPFRHSSLDGSDPVWEKIQIQSYNDCLARRKNESLWIAFLDLDEFCYCVDQMPLSKFLKKFESYGGVVANWHLFGSSNLDEIPENKTLIESLTFCSLPNDQRNYFVKSIVQPNKVVSCFDAHKFNYVEGSFAVDEDKIPFLLWKSELVKHKKLKINHYWTRNKNYFLEEKIKRRQSWHNASSESLWKRYDEYNLTQNFDILPFVSKLRNRLGFK